MKKHLLQIVFLLGFMMNGYAKNGLELITDGSDLYDPEIENFVGFQVLDERYLYFVRYHEDNGYSDHYEFSFIPYVYDYLEKRLIQFTRENEPAETYRYASSTYADFDQDSPPYFTYHDGKIYYVSGYLDSKLVVYDLKTDERMIHAIDQVGSNYIQSMVYDNELYLAISGDNFQLLKVGANSITQVFKTDVYMNKYVKPLFLRAIPIFHNNRLFINEVNQIRVYDFTTQTLDTLMTVDSVLNFYDNDHNQDFYTSMITQTHVYEDELYVVYKNALFVDGRIEYAFTNYIDSATVWKSDGTKEGTKKVFTDELGSMMIVNMNSRIMEINNNLCWLGIDHSGLYYALHKIDHDGLKNIGVFEDSDFPFLIDYQDSYVNNYVDRRLRYTYLFDNSLNIRDISGWFGFEIGRGLKKMKLWTVENDSLKYMSEYNLPESIYTTETFSINSDSILLFEFHGPISIEDTTYKIVLSIIDLKNDIISNIDTVNAIFYPSENIVYKYGCLFFAGIQPNDDRNVYSIWRYKPGNPTSIKSQQAISQNIFSVYPNPATNTVTIQSSESLDGQLMIVGVDGKIHQTIRMNGYQQKLNTSQLNNGMYVIVYQSDEVVSSQVIVITK